jgi:hypothetical protein
MLFGATDPPKSDSVDAKASPIITIQQGWLCKLLMIPGLQEANPLVPNQIQPTIESC